LAAETPTSSADVEEEMRGQGVESLDDVKWCVLESSGTMSFVKSSG
jgi:uncharacterized membrane protein YcaP (DUF421 family)